MPELPDVENYRHYMDATSLHQKIAGVEVESPSVLEDTTPQGLGRSLKGSSFETTHRHGKYLFTQLKGDEWLGMHFGMTGRLEYCDSADTAPDYTRCLFRFSNGGGLAYIAPRKLGRIVPVDSVAAFVARKNLGPDVMDLDTKAFKELAHKRNGKVKPWLMNQSVMAGLGNVYSDEVLFQARIHPDCPLPELDQKALGQLHRATTKVMSAAIKAEAKPDKMPKSFLLPHRRAGDRCPRCGGPVEKIKAAGRTAWLCPRCQGC